MVNKQHCRDEPTVSEISFWVIRLHYRSLGISWIRRRGQQLNEAGRGCEAGGRGVEDYMDQLGLVLLEHFLIADSWKNAMLAPRK